MKRRIVRGLLLVSSLIAVLQVGCQQQAKVVEEPAAPAVTEPAKGQVQAAKAPAESVEQGGPKIEFQSLVYDFGKVGPGQKMDGHFKFTNTGDAPLKITNVEKCCGAVTKLDKDELAPGEKGVLDVQYTSGRSAGKMVKLLYINSNDKAMPRAMLTIKAETILKVVYEPKRVELKLKGENAGCPQITLTSVDNQLFSVKSFTSSRNSVTADVDPSIEATRLVIKPVVDFEELQDLPAGIITIGLTHPECGVVTIYFSVLPKFKVTPPSAIVMRAEPNKPVIRRVSVESNYNEDFEVDSTSSKSGFAKVVGQKRTENGYEFEVEITPPNVDDSSTFTDMLYVKLKSGEKIEITCYGRYPKRLNSEGGLNL